MYPLTSWRTKPLRNKLFKTQTASLISVVSPVHYKMVPLYQGENICFDVLPNTTDLDVEYSSLTIPQQLEVIFNLMFFFQTWIES
jgi:hypothetical protein